MKKIICLGMLLWAFAAQAQLITENAIGIRFGGDFGVGAEISYQRLLGSDDRLELDLGIKDGGGGDVFQITGTYQRLIFIDKTFHFFYGGGGGFGNFSPDNDSPFNNNESYLIVMGVGGVEHSFNESGLPLQISLDVRPNLVMGDINDGFNLDFGLGLRYQF